MLTGKQHPQERLLSDDVGETSRRTTAEYCGTYEQPPSWYGMTVSGLSGGDPSGPYASYGLGAFPMDRS